MPDTGHECDCAAPDEALCAYRRDATLAWSDARAEPCECPCHDAPDTGTLGPTGDLDAPGDSAGGGVLWPASMGILDHPEDIDDGPVEQPPGTFEAFMDWLGDPLSEP